MMNISRTWRRILQVLPKAWSNRRFRSKGTGLPLGLSRDQVDSLRQLVGHHSWPTYSRLLELVAENLLAELLTGLSHEQYLAKCGEVRMVERLMELPHILLDKVTELEDQQNARINHDKLASDIAGAGLISTPFWDKHLTIPR